MIKLIVGTKGTGKTKILIDMIQDAAQIDNGSVVCIDKSKSNKLRYQISHSVRLINVEDYEIMGHDMFAGFILGVLSANYDINEIYIDSLFKIVGRDYIKLERFFKKIEESAKDIKIVFTVSEDLEKLPEYVQELAKR
ncbi:MAG: hypothetical protein FWH14_02330 [Oscillospiraceae bacterium]|nr:hypothetical protein [Oscillospiraceae bacterium]